jgi:hypothetical protein
MAVGPYVRERQAKYWTSKQINDYFDNADLEIIPFPLTRVAEPGLPANFMLVRPAHAEVLGTLELTHFGALVMLA